MEACLFEPRDRAMAAARALSAGMDRQLAPRQSALAALAGRLHALSPLATLERGYAMASDREGRSLASSRDFVGGSEFVLRLHDGEVDARVVAVRSDGGSAA
jgi:exodeoxyribonuclease VII large subunit